MRWAYETCEQRRERRLRWHKWFAWYPVRYKGTAWWLCYVERSIEEYEFIYGYFKDTKYRDLQNQKDDK